MDLLSVLFRWLHVAAGILWIGLLYWFNFVNASFAATMDGDTKKKVVPELMPRSLYWFRWAAAYTWVTGILLLALVFYHGSVETGGIMFDNPEKIWSSGSIIMLIVALLAFAIYDPLAKSGLGKNLKVFGPVAFLLIAIIVYLMSYYGGFSYRAYVIHTGAMFGTIMAANVWMRIWPSQRKIITAIKNGEAPDPAVVALAGARSRHNTYLSVPLVYSMLEAHTEVPGASSLLYLLGAIIVGWGVVALVYKKAGQVKGF
jgi:uncharacterized membrane protein